MAWGGITDTVMQVELSLSQFYTGERELTYRKEQDNNHLKKQLGTFYAGRPRKGSKCLWKKWDDHHPCSHEFTPKLSYAVSVTEFVLSN